jgi:hypothetical protein
MYEVNEDLQHMYFHNEVYLKALQRESVPVYALGFKKLKFAQEYPVSEKSSKFPQAVIPKSTQVYYLDRLEESVKYLEEQKIKEINSKKRAKSASRLYGTRPALKIDVTEIQKQIISPPKSSINKSGTEPKLPSFGRPTQRILEGMEEARRIVALQEKFAAKQKKSEPIKPDNKFAFVENGIQYVYNHRGQKVTIEEFEREKIAKEEKKKLEEQHQRERENEELQAAKKAVAFTGAILEKTSKYVDSLRQQAASVRNSQFFLKFLLFLTVSIFLNRSEMELKDFHLQAFLLIPRRKLSQQIYSFSFRNI